MNWHIEEMDFPEKITFKIKDFVLFSIVHISKFFEFTNWTYHIDLAILFILKVGKNSNFLVKWYCLSWWSIFTPKRIVLDSWVGQTASNVKCNFFWPWQLFFFKQNCAFCTLYIHLLSYMHICSLNSRYRWKKYKLTTCKSN